MTINRVIFGVCFELLVAISLLAATHVNGTALALQTDSNATLNVAPDMHPVIDRTNVYSGIGSRHLTEKCNEEW